MKVIDASADEAPRHPVILAGGKGVRLRPYTTSLPKPLLPLGDECAILEVVLRQLAGAGFASVSLAIGHLGQLIRAYVGDGTPVRPRCPVLGGGLTVDRGPAPGRRAPTRPGPMRPAAALRWCSRPGDRCVRSATSA